MTETTYVETSSYGRGIDGTTQHQDQQDVTDPHAYAVNFCTRHAMVGTLTVKAEAEESSEPDCDVGTWTYVGQWKSTGEPYTLTLVAEFRADISRL